MLSSGDFLETRFLTTSASKNILHDHRVAIVTASLSSTVMCSNCEAPSLSESERRGLCDHFVRRVDAPARGAFSARFTRVAVAVFFLEVAIVLERAFDAAGG
jgi:hypothetical protein